MPDKLDDDTIDGLAKALCNNHTLQVSDSCTVVWAALPGRAVATCTRVDGHLWVVVDLDKPCANRHARAMLNEARCDLLPYVDFGDDDLNREWQAAIRIPRPRPGDAPARVTLAG